MVSVSVRAAKSGPHEAGVCEVVSAFACGAWKEMTADTDLERFQTGAAKYAAYLETPEGRLRLDLAFANLQDFLPPQGLCTCAADQARGPTGMKFRWFLCTIAYAPAIRSPISGKAEWFSSESFFNSGCE